ncbi:hypothetical protein U1Q18_051407 [Sarracenia purpurea var. burkii]
MDRYRDLSRKEASIKKVFGGRKPSPDECFVSSTSDDHSSSQTVNGLNKQTAIYVAENGLRIAEGKLRSAESNLQAAKDLQCRAASNVTRVNNSSRDGGGPSTRLIDFTANSEVLADRSVIMAEQHAQRMREEVERAKYILQAAMNR